MLDNETAYKGYNSCTWSVTFTVRPELYQLPAFRQLSRTWGKLHDVLRMYTQSYVCVAELTKDDNVHYHTILQPSTLSPYSLNLMRDSLKNSKSLGMCYINMNTIKNKGQWIKTYNYITKEYDKTNHIVNKTGTKKIHEIISYGKININVMTPSNEEWNNSLESINRGI